jgi:hypothetical protein
MTNIGEADHPTLPRMGAPPSPCNNDGGEGGDHDDDSGDDDEDGIANLAWLPAQNISDINTEILLLVVTSLKT